MCPAAGGRGWDQHRSNGEQRAEGLEADDEVEQDQDGEQGAHAVAAGEAQEYGVEGVDRQRAVKDGEQQHGQGADRGDLQQGGGVDRQYGTEQHPYGVDVAAEQGHQSHTQGKGYQVEREQAGVVPWVAGLAEESSEGGDQSATGEPSQTEGEQGVTGIDETEGRAGHDGMGQY